VSYEIRIDHFVELSAEQEQVRAPLASSASAAGSVVEIPTTSNPQTSRSQARLRPRNARWSSATAIRKRFYGSLLRA
jgi:hypothetical protein